MNETSNFASDFASDFDRLRAWADGTMAAGERARFEAEIASDPDFARRAAEFRAVWTTTAGAIADAPPSRTTFDELMRRADPFAPRTERASPIRRVAAAALIALVAGTAVAWIAWKQRANLAGHVEHGDARRVVLHAIPLGAPPISYDVAPSVPGFLASWAPVEGSTIRWLDSLQDARAASIATDRPIFVYGYVQGCPLCKQLNETTFHDPNVTALVERCVPVAIDLMTLDQAQREVLWERRYPLLEIQDSSGDILHTFSGTFLDVDVHSELEATLTEVPRLAWNLVHELTARLVGARVAEARGELATAVQAFEELVRRREAPAFEREGEKGVQRIAEAARLTLETARAQAGASVTPDEFTRATQRFAGTPYEPDLRAVLEAWQSSGRFPDLSTLPDAAR